MSDLPAGFKTAANIKYWRRIGITATQPTIAKAIVQMREDAIADKTDNGMSAEEAGRWADEHLAQVRGERTRDISINIAYGDALKNEITKMGSWVAHTYKSLLGLAGIHGDDATKKQGIQEVRNDAIHHIIARESKRQDSLSFSERKPPEVLHGQAEREARETVAKEEGGIWYIQRAYLPQLKEKTDAIQAARQKDTSDWIGSGNRPRFKELGISGTNITREAAIRRLFKDSVRKEAGEHPTPQSIRRAVHWVSTHIARCKPTRNGPDSWNKTGNWQVHTARLYDLQYHYLDHEKIGWRSVEEMAKTEGITRNVMLKHIKDFVTDKIQELERSGMSRDSALQLIDNDWVAQVDWGSRKVYRVSFAGEDEMKDWWKNKQVVSRNGWATREAKNRARRSESGEMGLQ